MNKDLKLIKKYYGEDLMHYCRTNFPTLVEENKIFKLLNKYFQHNKYLFNDLKKYNLLLSFNNFIMKFAKNNEPDNLSKTVKTPLELMSEAGYNLYECKSDKDIQSFKKYYALGEELCTFDDNRLTNYHVFFAVKKDVDNIKRENFLNPKRQDEYGTSVISIQFTKDKSHSLSIKNRYNHTVNHPDNTFNNNLDNIIEGLTYSFAKYYDLKQENINSNFKIPSYIFVRNKYYKYNLKIKNAYYCIDNVIIERNIPKSYDKEKYIIMDEFILDLVKKGIFKHSSNKNEDAFLSIKRNIEKIDIVNTDYGKRVTLFNKNKTFEVILLNKENNIIGYVNNYIKNIGNYFLYNNVNLKYLELNNVLSVGHCFLNSNEKLKQVNLPKVIKIGHSFMYFNQNINEIKIPKCKKIDDYFLCNNHNLINIYFPKVKTIGRSFMAGYNSAKEIYLPQCIKIEDNFLKYNISLESLYLPKCQSLDYKFVKNNINTCQMIVSPILKEKLLNSLGQLSNSVSTEKILKKIPIVKNYYNK